MIETASIKETLDLKFKFKTKYTKEEFDQIDSIKIERIDNDQTLLPVNFKEILLFPNLQKLHINNCILDKSIVEVIELSPIKELYLTNCEIVEEIETNIFELPIEKILVDNTPLKVENKFSTSIPYITFSNIKIPLIQINCQELNISQAIINEDSIFSSINAEYLIISEMLYKKYESLIKEKFSHVKVLNKYKEIVEEIK